MIAIRPSIFCFIGKLAPDLYATVPVAIRRRLGAVPDVFAFVSVTEAGVDLKLGTRRPKLPLSEGALQNRLWHALTFSAGAIGNIRVRTDALRRPAESEAAFQVVRGGPDIYLVECLSDPMGWEMLFAIAEKIHFRTETPAGTGRARGIFPLFHLPSEDEDMEREQALDGLRRLEKLTASGVLFPSIVLDRVNRNGHPLERWEDLTELLSDFLALGSASEAAPDIWRVFPQVADLRGIDDEEGPGLTSMGLARFRFHREKIGEELAHLHLRDLKRSLGRTFSAEPVKPDLDDSKAFLAGLAGKGLSSRLEGMKVVEAEVAAWMRKHHPAGPALGAWAVALDRLQKVVFERLGEVAQKIENARQENQALQLETPLRDRWMARISVSFPAYYGYVPLMAAGALLGTWIGLITSGISLTGYILGGGFGLVLGWIVAFLLRSRWKQAFILGEFPEGMFPGGFPVPKSLERYSRLGRPGRKSRSSLSLQMWGELRSQLDPAVKERLDATKARIEGELESGRQEEAELVFLDRAVNSLRECVETWKARLGEVELVESGRGFSGDIFPSDGPRRIYEYLRGREAAEQAAGALLPKIAPSMDSAVLMDMADEVSMAWGREKVADLQLRDVFGILDDRPEDLVERLSEASAPLWPRPGDRDELICCYGKDFAWLARDTDLRHSLSDETIFLRVLGGVRSGELAIQRKGREEESGEP